MNVVNQLYHLQEFDLALELNEQTLKRIASQLGESQVVARAQAKLASERQCLEELGRQQHSTEWDIDDLSNKISAVEEQLYGGRIGNPKELADLQHEVETLKARRGQLEDEVLATMEQVELAVAGERETPRSSRWGGTGPSEALSAGVQPPEPASKAAAKIHIRVLFAGVWDSLVLMVLIR